MEKIIFTTGGTGGHIYPALAIAKELKDKKDIKILFIGTKHRMESEIIPKEGYEFMGLDVKPLKSISSIFKIVKESYKMIRFFSKDKPTKVIGFGNYISIPSLVAAKFLKIPYYLQEQNSVLGLANSKFYKGSKKVFVSFENTLNVIPDKYKDKFVVTGTPLRKEFYNLEKESSRKELNIPLEKKVILVLGGSLGAKKLNECIIEKIDEIKMKDNLILFWATGKSLYEDTISKIENFDSIKNIMIRPYFDNVGQYMSSADLVVCRAGASTVSELIQLEKPSILIPLGFVGQPQNAEVIEYANGGKVFDNEKAKEAIDEAFNLIDQEDILDFMKENLKPLKKGEAVCDILKHMDLENVC